MRAGDPDGSDQLILCFPDLICNFPEDSLVKTIRECCLDDPDGLSYVIPGVELCFNCIGKHLLSQTIIQVTELPSFHVCYVI